MMDATTSYNGSYIQSTSSLNNGEQLYSPLASSSSSLDSPQNQQQQQNITLFTLLLHELFNYYRYLILENKMGVLIHLHTVFILLYYACRFVLLKFLGNVTQKEKDAFSNGLIPYVTINTLFVFYILNHFKNINYLNEIIIWIVWLSVTGILKSFNIVCRVRSSTMMEDVIAPHKEKHLKVITLLTIICFTNLGMIIFATIYIIGFYNNDYSYYLLFIYENVTLFLENTRIFAKYGGFVCEIFGLINTDTHRKSSENESSFIKKLLSTIFHNETIYITRFVLEILLLVIATMHYMHVWYNNGLNFAVIDLLLFALINNSFNEFRIQASRLLEYRRISRMLKEQFPAPTLEECRENELCTICHESFHLDHVEELQSCTRKLECGHVFHLICITQWMRCSFTCPICRRDVIREVNKTTSSGNDESKHEEHTGTTDHHHSGMPSTSGDETPTSPVNPHTTTLLSTSGNWLPFSLKIEETSSDIESSDDEDGMHDSFGESAANLQDDSDTTPITQ